MSKIAEKKAKEIAKNLESSQAYKFDNFSIVCGAIEGYDKAMQDFLEKAEEFLKNRTMAELCLDSESTELVEDFVDDFKNYMQNE